MNKIIEFSAHEDLIDIEDIKPKPTKNFVPNWYKKIPEHKLPHLNIKGCMPFLDGITAGYVLPLPQDIKISYNNYNPELKKNDIFIKYSATNLYKPHSQEYCKELNINWGHAAIHGIGQIGGKDSFMVKKNNNFNILKILNPWKIKTPKGYSCLFISPVQNENDYFNIITAIVDTDTFDDKINFPIIINADKYSSFDKVFSRGLPYVQIIPFKRDDWENKILKEKVNNTFINNFVTQFVNRYKKLIWKKKKWM